MSKAAMLGVTQMPLDWRLAFGRRLRGRREALGLTHHALYLLTGARSCNGGHLKTLEQGLGGAPSLNVLLRLAPALRCNLHWLLTGAGPAEPPA